jgi:hypothetical protein
MTDWDRDWTYGYLAALLRKIAETNPFALLGDAVSALEKGERVAFLRHDVDMSLERARDLAAKEVEWGIRATYHVMTKNPFYDCRDPAMRALLREIVAGGHEVGLHFDPSGLADTVADVETAMRIECKTLEDVLDQRVRSISFHMPSSSFIRGPLLICDGRVNAYAAPLLEWYLSDSRGRWREGEPMKSVEKPRAKHLQVLVHPLWWNEHQGTAQDRLAELVASISKKTERSFDEVAREAYDHILVRARPAA